jgi:hypothetical protein
MLERFCEFIIDRGWAFLLLSATIIALAFAAISYYHQLDLTAILQKLVPFSD